MIKIVPWLNGSGNITLTYSGQGDGPILVESDPNNLAVARSQALHVNADNLSVEFTVNQQAGQSPQPTDYIDLNLPSGLLWAKGNIVKDAQGNYSMGSETDYGCYFSWGNIEGHNRDEGYDFGTSINGPYASTPGALIGTDIASNDSAHDAALACLGSPWHLPTKNDFQELYDNTDNEWTTIDGTNGLKFMKKTDHTIFVFFPAAGYGRGSSFNNVGTYGGYWSSSWYSANNAYYMLFNKSSVTPQRDRVRYNGFPVRAVRSSG